ncbi:MAG: CHAT domain-containing protein [Candidatus Hydrogenedentes bacterium]|nr:CHAT domain-containing protein [Candidatus Hydrogenedentota bacterium]
MEIEFEVDGAAKREVTSRFNFALTTQDREDIRWYLEEFLEYPQDPAPRVAERIEARIEAIGEMLFNAIFGFDDFSRELWMEVQNTINATRVQIVESDEEAMSIPWELIRDPKRGEYVALTALAFVRSRPESIAGTQDTGAEARDERFRVLLVICRPKRENDVPFRSVAIQIMKGLGESYSPRLQFDVLRPPTFRQLELTVRQAKQNGFPYRIVHFDGHGIFLDDSEQSAGMHPADACGLPHRARGYICFEKPERLDNRELIDGTSLGRLLADSNVSILVLNACRSAHAQPRELPNDSVGDGSDTQGSVLAFGSLAQEAVDQGVTGVVAMRYNVYVVTAAHFMTDLYSALIQGSGLGEAVSRGRGKLHSDPMRAIAFSPTPLQDWSVPIVYERVPVYMLPKSNGADTDLHVSNDLDATACFDPQLPNPPDAGFLGRDETLLALDRAFDTESIVLLHAYVGSGKTAVAAEFARWYSRTGGIKAGRVLFSSFDTHITLRSVLDHFGEVFRTELEKSKVNWDAVSDVRDMSRIVLRFLERVPILWIWDNIQPITGFPDESDTPWTLNERKEIADFLREANETSVKLLLTSRRKEWLLLGNLPQRIALPKMPMRERIQLTKALSERRGHQIADVNDWRPLLDFSDGNPLTITVLVNQVLADNLVQRSDIELLVAQLRAGEADFTDEEFEGLSTSLGRSLDYSFRYSFTDLERKQIALLHIFQGCVFVRVLVDMGRVDSAFCIDSIKGVTEEYCKELLDRVANCGVLAPLGNGRYSIHPAFPWYLKPLYNSQYSDPLATKRSFTMAIGTMGHSYHNQFGNGNRIVLELLAAEEANFLHARELARANEWWSPLVGTMQGLWTLCQYTGQSKKWRYLVGEITQYFIDSNTGGPLPGRDAEWLFVAGYRISLAEESRDWMEAERLEVLWINWTRDRAKNSLSKKQKKLNNNDRHLIRSLSVALQQAGHTQRAQGKSQCIEFYDEGMRLSKLIGDAPSAAIIAYNLGRAYTEVSSLKDLNSAEKYYLASLAMHHSQDLLGKARCMAELGKVSSSRFEEGLLSSRPEAELVEHFEKALGYYEQVLRTIPSDDINMFGLTHGQLGNLYRRAGQFNMALEHHLKCLRYEELRGVQFDTASARFNIALDFGSAGRFSESLIYAKAALRDFEDYGPRAVEMAERTKELIAICEVEASKMRGTDLSID